MLLDFLHRSKSPKSVEDYYSVLIQLNYDGAYADKAQAFFSGLYFELTVNFGFNFIDRVFYRIDTKESIASLLKAAIKVIMIQQCLSKEDVNKIIKHAFIIPLQQFDDLKNEICR
jgi:hypothetical protein